MAELGDAGGAVARARDHDADGGKTLASQLRAQVVAHAQRVLGAEEVAAIEHDQLVPQAWSEGAQVAAVDDLVLVFLGVDDPGDGVDARKERIDALAVFGSDGVEIR